MNISVSFYSACGIRPKNEDSVSIQESANGVLAVVADGLGGHGKGEVASSRAVSVLNNYILTEPISAAGLTDAILRANEEICAMQTEETAMKTTVAVLGMDGSSAVAMHVGDSRIYQIRDGEIIFQSMDHSVAQLAVLVGEITPNELRTHPDQNKLVRCVGSPTPPKIDISFLDVRPGDHFLLCSDGFWEPVTEEMMLHTLKKTDSVERWLEIMRQTAQAYSRDNHTAIAIRINAC